jgi:N-sulfoglucosamine sulfohydrolase
MRVSRSRSLLLAAISLAVCGLACAPRAQRQPWNLLVLVADDASRVNFGVYGNPTCTTPSVDALASQGMRFEHAYTPVSLCSPSRTSMYTGLYPIQHGSTGFDPVRADVATWPELFAGTGVVTGSIGKQHVEPKEKFPFDFVEETDALLNRRSPRAYEAAFEEFLELAAGRPFTLFVNFKDPHRPFGHKREVERGGPERLHSPEDVELFPFLVDTPETRTDLARFYDALARMDETLGRLLARLDQHGLAERTVVVFTSDNGMPFPFAKCTLFEVGLNLPFVVRWPGVVEAGTVSDELVSLIDLLPTALELCELPVPEGLAGRSLVPLLAHGTPLGRSEVYGMHTSQKVGEDYPVRSVRSGPFEYVRNLRPEARFDAAHLKTITWESWLAAAEKDDAAGQRVARLLHRPREQLFDLEHDPFELRDLARDPEYEQTRERLAALLEARLRELGDPLLGEW